MTRKKHYTRKRKKEKRTILFFGEGSSECFFLKHIRKIYDRNPDIKITIKDGGGGSADMVVANAIRCYGLFDEKIVVIDNDKASEEMQ